MKLKEATEGFLLSLRAGGYSQSTIDLYRYALDRLSTFLDDPEMSAIKLNDLNRYFVYLQDMYVPNRKNGSNQRLSGGSLQNHWKAIRSLFNWATEELRLKKRPDERLRLPPRNPKIVHAFTQEEMKLLIKAAEFTREAKTDGRKPFQMRRRTADRDLSLLFVLIDTGVRVGEAGRFKIRNYDPKTGALEVEPFGNSNRKTKSRTVYLGKSGQKALWRYLATRKDADPDDPLFLSVMGRAMDSNSIRLLVVDLGSKAGVKNVHPHRFRHSFALEFLRNSGDAFSLKILLGHSSLDMVETYINLAATDTQNAHRKASPADRWKL